MGLTPSPDETSPRLMPVREVPDRAGPLLPGGCPRGRGRGYMLNGQFARPIPFNRIDTPVLSWRTEGTKNTKKSHGQEAIPQPRFARRRCPCFANRHGRGLRRASQRFRERVVLVRACEHALRVPRVPSGIASAATRRSNLRPSALRAGRRSRMPTDAELATATGRRAASSCEAAADRRPAAARKAPPS